MARGRMLNQTVCASLKFQHLPDDTCRLLATWIIPHLDLNGVFYADPAMVKSAVFPRRADITPDIVGQYLDAIEDIGLIVRFHANGDYWQWWPGFADNQVGLRRDRETTTYPPPPTQDDGKEPEPIRQDDGTNPAEEKGTEEKGTEDPKGADAPSTSLSPPRTFQEWESALDTYTNRPALVRRMVELLYPGLDPPDYGLVGMIAKKMGRGKNGYHRLMGLLWEYSARPPQGDLLPYLLRVHQGKERDNGRTRQGHDGDGAAELSDEQKAIAAAFAADGPGDAGEGA